MKILVIGSSGWLAHYVLKELISKEHQIFGISNEKNPLYEISNHNVAIEDSSFINIVDNHEVDIVINMLHSKNYPIALETNNNIANLCKSKGIRYVYCSSSNALDGDIENIHTEKDSAIAESDYGKFKAAGEEHLVKTFPEAVILRFPAVHGYSPNRAKRTQIFLEKMQNEEEVIINKGIVQNRPFAGHFAKMLVAIALSDECGVFHIGTTDYGEELSFLKKLAKSFGYNENSIKEGEFTPHKMVVLPQRVLELDKGLNFTQDDTIQALVNDEKLSIYKKK